MEIVPAGNNCNRVFGDDGPSFFKIIHGRAMEELRIPPHFMKHLVNEVADRATLESPSGDLCTVLLHQKENGTYLQDGWPDFVRNHSLGNNEFLIFRYDGSLHFSVRIYDVSGLERVGASVTCKHQEAGSSIEKRKRGRPRKNKIDSLPLQQLEVSKPCEPEAASSTGRRKPGRPRKKVDPINFHQSDVSAELCKPEAASSTGRRKGGRPRKKVDPINLHLTENAPEARKHKVDPINSPQSESCKHAPEAASKEERKRGRPRKKEVTDTLILHQSESCKHAAAAASSGKRKPGRPRKRDDLLHHSKSPKYAEGVKKFKKIKHTKRKMKGQELESIIEEAKYQLKVNKEEKDNIRRKKRKCEKHKEHHSRTMQPPTEEERAGILEKADSFMSNFLCYKCFLKQLDVQKMFLLPISKSFSQSHFPPFRTDIVLWNSKGKGWIVTEISVAGRHSFSEGWRSFVLDNKLKEGDVCIFELVKSSEIQVHVFRVRQS